MNRKYYKGFVYNDENVSTHALYLLKAGAILCYTCIQGSVYVSPILLAKKPNVNAKRRVRAVFIFRVRTRHLPKWFSSKYHPAERNNGKTPQNR